VLTLVWAQSRNGTIGRDGILPWHLPEDLAHFANLTRGGSVLMGRRTWDSLPAPFRPLPDRRNIVLTGQPDWTAPGASVVHTMDEAATLTAGGDLWVIGGRRIFDQFLEHADRLDVTEINADVDGDTRAPAIDTRWRVDGTDPGAGWHTSRTGLEYRFLRYTPAARPD